MSIRSRLYRGNWSLFRFGWDSNRDRAGIVLGIGKSLDCWQYVGEGKEV